MKLLFLPIIPTTIVADLYFNHPAGSNNRLNEDQRAVRNDNRLFDSQNNNRHGYNVQGMSWYEKTEIDLQWTVQHGCGPNSNVDCEIILQYSCEDQIRNGETTDTIPEEQDECQNDDCNTDPRFGMHESFQEWQHCALRSRNKRLFPADRNLRNRHSARHTRQEEAGARYGYECNEERDYYPYWHPTIWKDIVIMTDHSNRCDYYKKESQNVKDKAYCHVDDEILNYFFNKERAQEDAFIPIYADECNEWAQSVQQELTDNNISGSIEWKNHTSWGIAPPECIENVEHRDNHHGNVNGPYLNSYKWTVPSDIVANGNLNSCVFRVRYNMSSIDYEGWTTNSDHKIRDDEGCMCRNNYGVDLWTKYGMSGADAKRRGFRHLNDPLLRYYPMADMKEKTRLRNPYNTNQLGRVFEDRTHVIGFRQLPADIAQDLQNNPTKKIHNLNIIGRLGNYNEVFPNFPYMFLPQYTSAKLGDYLHIQWTGANNQNTGNDHSQVDYRLHREQEIEGKDRHNLIQIDSMGDMTPNVNNFDNIFGFGSDDAQSLAFSGIYGGENFVLQSAGSHFDLGLRKLETEGSWNFVNSQNNRFGVLAMKGRVDVRV